jgi:hypothetical protein
MINQSKWVQQRRALLLQAGAAIVGSMALQAAPQAGQAQSSTDHWEWVAEALVRMETIGPGMTKQALLTVLTTEGGISSRLHGRFVSRDCPYFKIDVEFRTVGPSDREENGRVTSVEDSGDIIIKVSRPYLEFSIRD